MKKNTEGVGKVKAFASVTEDGDIKMFVGQLASYCIFPSAEQAKALNRAFPQKGTIEEIEIRILKTKKKH